MQIGYNTAWHFAAKAHKDQKLPGSDLPYLVHIGWVAGEILIALRHESVSDSTLAVQCAILHDVLEDTAVDYDTLCKEFGRKVADGVAALTKDAALPKDQRMRDSLERICAMPKEIGMVKLADRIANLRPPPGFWDGRRIGEYADEAQLILDKLGPVSPYLRQRLEIKLMEYRAKFSNQSA
ncbi:MAG: bifunctional (p)ppGpp synthetase/guanosine-3',5'-bis(diphosphate) 3'-pyrophosphohydrolase [Desulfobacterales bacterium]|nr:bifunctional (p)ppGpp synthetase/guanosine-3',5'-bis(diphosphate) 3'-pyrophosphohydrolase [Desulfobacterales bacterium]